jgi:hypothetical protein
MHLEDRYYAIARCLENRGMSDNEIAATGAKRIGLLWEGRPDVWREKVGPREAGSEWGRLAWLRGP